MTEIKQAVILCGGLGSRLGEITKILPKPMVDVVGKPFLEHLIIQLKKNGIKEVYLLVGYKNEIIKNYFGNGKKFNIRIKYSYMPSYIKTGTRLYKVKNQLNKKFILLYCDNYSSLNIHKLNSEFTKLKKNILVSLVKKNNGNCNYEKALSSVIYSKKRSKKNSFVEIGYMIMSKNILKSLKNTDKDFSDFLLKISKRNEIAGIVNENSYLSIGDKKRLNITRKLFSNNNTLLVDRDGVLNISPKKRYITKTKELRINKNICSKLPKNSNLLCITNQAGLSTKDLTMDNLKKINLSIKHFLEKKKIYIKEFFVSHHHFKSKSHFRKPNPGLFYKASKKYKFILDKTFYIGDDKRDIEAAYNANTYIVYVGKKKLTPNEKLKYKFIILENKISKLYNEKIKNNF
jgi:histidinol-phosphate phosphatase family protein